MVALCMYWNIHCCTCMCECTGMFMNEKPHTDVHKHVHMNSAVWEQYSAMPSQGSRDCTFYAELCRESIIKYMCLCYRRQKYTSSWGDEAITAEDRELLELALTLTCTPCFLALSLLQHWCQPVLCGSAKESASCVWDSEN